MTSENTSRVISYKTVGNGTGEVTLYFDGRLDINGSYEVIKPLTSMLRSDAPASLTVDLEKVSYLDDFGVAMLATLKKIIVKSRGKFSLINGSNNVKALLALHRFHEMEPDTDQFEHKSIYRRSDPFTWLGEVAVGYFNELKFMLTFLGTTIFSFLHIIRHPRSFRRQDTLLCMQSTGVEALPIVGLISFLLGLIMAFMSSVQLRQFGANIYVASLVALSMTRELGPIMTAIIVAGRSSSAFAAEIGSMKISEEVDALFTMGFEPNLFLVVPRIVASFLVVPLLTLFSDVFAILGGLIVGVGMLDLTVNGYMTQTIKTLSLFDVFWGVAKSGIFALLISLTGCLRGFQVRGGASAVGRATTSAVVTSIFLIILADSLLVVILRYWE